MLRTQLAGDYNLPNVLAAVAVGCYFKVPPANIPTAIAQYTVTNSRSQLLQWGTNTIILDAYNANPSSMKAAIINFAKLAATPKMLILGAMAELGKDSLDEHQQIINLIGQYPWKEVVLVGGDFQRASHPYRRFASAAEAKQWLAQQDIRHTHILIKGSRSMQMEKVLEK